MERSRVAGEAPTQTRILLASLSAMVAETVTFPIDLTKTRMQLHGSGSSSDADRIGAIGVVSEIARHEGVIGLYIGLSPAIIRHLFYTPIRIIGYENLKGYIVRSEANNCVSLPFATKALVGGISGVLAQLAMITPNTLSLRKRSEDNIYAHTLASIMSGLASTTLSCPADVVKTRMMNQGETVVYRNSYECLVKTVKFEGIRALWKGFFPTWARLGPWQFVFWVSYEKFRQLAGLSSF